MLFPTASYEQQEAKNEDDICADYVEALVLGRTDAEEQLAEGIAFLHESKRFQAWEQGDPDLPFADIAAVLSIDRFPFAIEGQKKRWREIDYIDARRVDHTSGSEEGRGRGK